MSDWIERQIREAQARGEFDDLPGAGKPLRPLGPMSAESWAREWIQREGGDVDALLHPMLMLRKERAALLASLAQWPSEATVAEAVTDFNQRLLDQYRRPSDGPLIAVGVLDLDDVLVTWRSVRPAPVPVEAPVPTRRRRRWFRRRWFQRYRRD